MSFNNLSDAEKSKLSQRLSTAQNELFDTKTDLELKSAHILAAADGMKDKVARDIKTLEERKEMIQLTIEIITKKLEENAK